MLYRPPRQAPVARPFRRFGRFVATFLQLLAPLGTSSFLDLGLSTGTGKSALVSPLQRLVAAAPARRS